MSKSRVNLKRLPELMKTNSSNRLVFYEASGIRKEKLFCEIYQDIITVLAAFSAQGKPLRPGMKCVIMAESNYNWLISALSCIFLGTTVIVVPETLNNVEASDSLSCLSFDIAITSRKYADFEVFKSTDRVIVEELEEALSTSDSYSDIEADKFSSDFSLVAFTSGSTASTKIKSFSINPESTEFFIQEFVSAFEIEKKDNWVVCHSFSHIIHFEYVLGGLCWGYNITLASPAQVIMSGKEISPSVLVTVPGTYDQLLSRIFKKLSSDRLRNRIVHSLLKLPVNGVTRRLGMLARPYLLPEVEEVIGHCLKVAIIGAAPSTLELKRLLVLLGVPLYEGYGMSEVGMISCNTPQSWRFSSVGKPFPGTSLRLNDKNVIEVSTSFQRTNKYENQTEIENKSTFHPDGWISTGDIGELDEKGYLYIRGREKNLIITNRGKNINPAPIESALEEIEGVRHAILVGDQKPYLVALLSPKPNQTLSEKNAAQAIENINSNLAAHSSVMDFHLLEKPLSVENGLLTRSGKPRRAAIRERYKSYIDNMY